MATMSVIIPIVAQWMPQRASTVAGEVDWLFDLILGIAAFFFLLVVTLLVYFVIRYRYREGREQPKTTSHNTPLELVWTIIPTIIVIIIFYFGFRDYMHMAVAPPDSYEIQVTARMWSWTFTYPNGAVTNDLHVPVATPVRLVLQSDDVIHSLYIPAFRLKKDVVPGRYNKLWFEATKTGTYDLYCASYCGTSHSQMISRVIVHDPEEFKRWLAQAGNWASTMTPAEAGRMLFERRGCMQCHSTDGSRIIGPTLKDLFASTVSYSGGKKLVADEDYVRESIYDPGAKVVDGFDNVMPSFKGTFTDKDVDAMIAYLKSISAHYKAPPVAPATAPATRPAALPVAGR
jgi:cytochrome c oxidase subunit 2